MSIKPGYTRVSEILAQWDDYEGVEKSILEKKAALGTSVHEAIMGFHENIHLPVAEEAQGYYDSFLQWYNVNKYPMEAVGRLYCETLKITGEIDAIIKVGSAWCLVDWKTTAAKNPKKWKLQGQFYHYLMSTNKKEISSVYYFIQLKKDGSFPTVEVYETDKQIMNVCMSAYICYKYMNKVDGKSQPDSKCSQH